jgi:UDP:flavonoid glycosyltransferase YjiC (YdhE family)
MTRVVFAWELGGFLGHVERNLAVAQRLREMGADVHFLVSNLPTAEKILAPEGFPYLPAPGFRHAQPPAKTAISISGLLADLGYGDPVTLRACVRSWIGLYKALKPDVIVTDYAPSAILSAKVAGIPTLPLGPGFSIPPGRDPMPSYREDQRHLHAELRAADQRLLPAINDVAAAFGHPAFDCVGNLFHNPAAQITSFPELDPFWPREDAHYVGPIKAPGRFLRVEWEGKRDKRIFAYLQPNMVGLDAILAAMRDPAREVVCVIPGASERILSRNQADGFRVLNEPVQLDELLAGANVVVCYASAGLVSGSLQAGVPMLLFPTFLEHQLTAMRAERMRAAIVCHGVPTREKSSKALASLLDNPAFSEGAIAFAERFSSYRQQDAIDSLAQTIQSCCAENDENYLSTKPPSKL